VQRQAVKGDLRVRLLEPSASGWKMLDQFAGARRRFVSKRLGDWTDEERATLLGLLRRFAATIASFETKPAASGPGRGASRTSP